MSATNFALVIRPDESFEVIDWPAESAANLRTLYAAIGCDAVDVADISPEASMWLDDDGINTGAPVNIAATQVYAVAQGSLHQFYYGTVVITGGPDRKGDTSGLSREQCDMILGLSGIDLPTIPHQRSN